MLIFVTVAGAGDRDAGYPGPAADQCRQVTNISQATRHATPAADLERGIYATGKYEYIRGGWQDVSQVYREVPWAIHRPLKPLHASRDRTTIIC